MRFIILSSLSVFCLNVWSAPIALKDAANLARSQSPELQRAASLKEEASWRKVESLSGFLPKVQATGSYLLDYKYVFTDINFGGAPVSIPGIVPTTVFGLNGQLNLFDGFASTNRLRSAKSMVDAASDEYKWAEFKISRTVALEFYRAMASQTLLRVAQSNLATLQDHLKDVRLFRKSGLSTNYDVLRVEVQVSEAESEILNTEDNYAVAQNRLGEVLGQAEPVEPTGTMPEMKPDLIKNLDTKMKNRADLQALNERVEAFDYTESAVASHWVPRIGAFGVYQYYNNRNDGFDDWDRYRNAYQVGLNLTWDLFDGFASTAKRHQAIEQKIQSEKSLKIAQLKAQQDIPRWERKFKYYCSIYKARQNDVAKSQEAVRLAKEGRKVGARTNTELLDAESDLFRAEATAVNAQLGAIEALINLELSTGQQLYNFEN